MDRLRICYIGAGRFTNRRNFPHLAEHDVDLVAVCDLEEEKARKAQEEYGFGKVYTDFRKMLEKEKPDAVFCVGPHRMHYGVGKEVLEMGFPLYTQKPPAANGQMAQEMADIAKRKGVVAHTGFTLRFSKAFRNMKRVMESGGVRQANAVHRAVHGPDRIGSEGSGDRYELARGRCWPVFYGGYRETEGRRRQAGGRSQLCGDCVIQKWGCRDLQFQFGHDGGRDYGCPDRRRGGPCADRSALQGGPESPRRESECSKRAKDRTMRPEVGGMWRII